MNKFLCCIMCLNVLWSWAQNENVDQYFEQQNKQNKYVKNRHFNGPKKWDSPVPTPIIIDPSQQNISVGKEHSPNNFFDISEVDIQKSREQIQQNNKSLKPEVRLPEPANIPKFSWPKLKINPINIPSVNVNMSRWEKIRLFLIKIVPFILILILLFVLYKFLLKINLASTSQNWNTPNDEMKPEEMNLMELKKKLDLSEKTQNYRECVRIYYLLSLKQLIKNKLINWKPEKTNFDYLSEMRMDEQYREFEYFVRIFNAVWYGHYPINDQHYAQLKPMLEQYYQSLNKRTLAE